VYFALFVRRCGSCRCAATVVRIGFRRLDSIAVFDLVSLRHYAHHFVQNQAVTFASTSSNASARVLISSGVRSSSFFCDVDAVAAVVDADDVETSLLLLLLLLLFNVVEAVEVLLFVVVLAVAAAVDDADDVDAFAALARANSWRITFAATVKLAAAFALFDSITHAKPIL
jgi:hypothetical protein